MSGLPAAPHVRIRPRRSLTWVLLLQALAVLAAGVSERVLADETLAGPWVSESRSHEALNVPGDAGLSPSLASPICDELWVVSSRRLPSSAPCPPVLDVQRLNDDGPCPSGPDDLFRPFAGGTVIYVHGNRYQPQDAIVRGNMYFQTLRACSAAPLRLVIWSWPSDQIRGAIRDVRQKAVRTRAEARYLGAFLRDLATFSPAEPIGLIGYSYGARVICGGLHVAAGGRVDGLGVPGPALRERRFRVVLLAAAIDYTWLCPGDEFGRAGRLIDRLALTINHRDPVLKYFRFLERGRKDRALGVAGLPRRCRCFPSIQCDVTRAVRGTHDERAYFSASRGLASQVLVGR